MASEEEIWKKRLREEDIPPPEAVWSAIEAELDRKSKKRGIWIFWVSGAGLAAMLLFIGFGVWVGLSPEGTTSARVVSKQDPLLSSEGLAQVQAVPITSDKKEDLQIEKSVFSTRKMMASVSQETSEASFSVVHNRIAMENPSSPAWEEVSKLQTRNVTFFGNRFDWNRPRLEVPELAEEKETKRPQSKFLSLQSLAAPFAPGVQWPGMAQQAFAAVNETLQKDQPLFTTSSGRFPEGILAEGDQTISSVYDPSRLDPEQRFERGWAVQLAAQAGMRFSEKWGVEVGIRYVQGENATQSNVYSWRNQDAAIQTFFESSILRQTKSESSIIGPKEVVETRYHWISMPIQGVYFVPVGEKWDLAFSAGLAVDKLMSNQWSSESYTPANSSYKPLALSTVGGVRVSRLIAPKWAVAGGLFGQHAISSWIGEESVQMKPAQLGGQMGLSYRF